MAIDTALVRAESFFTIDATADITDGETLVIAGKTYTFNDTLGSSDGDVHIGADVQGIISNIVAALNLSNEGESAVGAGTDYAAAMTRNPGVHGVEGTDTLTCQALIPGALGNLIPLTIGTSAAEVDNAVLEAGSGNEADFFEGLLALNQINSEVIAALKPFTVAVP